MKKPSVLPTQYPWRRAGALALALLISCSPALSRGPVGISVADLLFFADRLPPANANLPANLLPFVEPAGNLPGDVFIPANNIAGAPQTVIVLPPVVSAFGELVVPLGGVASNADVSGRPAVPGVVAILGVPLLPALPPLKLVAKPVVPGLDQFISDRQAAIVLGKALFWEAQVGSDNQACASCHFHAGADNRLKNQLNGGAADPAFNLTASGSGGPNYTLKASDFPTHRLANPDDRNSAMLFESDDVIGSQGTQAGAYTRLGVRGTEECGARALDAFNVHGSLTRRVTGRNTPSVINAVFNQRNFWDGRANNLFNGTSPFGNRDPGAKVLQRQADGTTAWVKIALANASLASQAVGPALSDVEMSCANKSFKELGRKLLPQRALQKQTVDATDSVLAPYRHVTGRGLASIYSDMIKRAFAPAWWSASGTYDGYTQMESNFSMFWGLAIMAYESTLVSDEAAIDKFIGWPGNPSNVNALTAQEIRGLGVFMQKGQCVTCHKGAEFTGAATELQAGGEANVVEHMFVNNGLLGVYDNGFYNIGVRPTAEDRGVGGKDPWGNTLSVAREYLDFLRGKPIPDPLVINPCLFSVRVDVILCNTAPDPNRSFTGVDGAFKTPGLRNVAFTQPYFHNGSRFTLEEVVEFYDRGGDRRGPDGNDTTGMTGPDAPNGGNSNIHPNVRPLGLTAEEAADLVAFLRYGLSDRRVACEQAPFDHPSLAVPNGHVGNEVQVSALNGKALDEYIILPAVGAAGLPASNCYKNDDGSAAR